MIRVSNRKTFAIAKALNSDGFLNKRIWDQVITSLDVSEHVDVWRIIVIALGQHGRIRDTIQLLLYTELSESVLTVVLKSLSYQSSLSILEWNAIFVISNYVKLKSETKLLEFISHDDIDLNSIYSADILNCKHSFWSKVCVAAFEVNIPAIGNEISFYEQEMKHILNCKEDLSFFDAFANRVHTYHLFGILSNIVSINILSFYFIVNHMICV